MDLLKIPLFSQALGPRDQDPHAEPRKRLLDALLQMRDRARMLANEIHRDLPDFTVHDITHLDALWEMADLIAGPDYPLNPLEAFALGAVFLLHDLGLGLAAYPGGLAELKKGPGWQDAVSTYLRKHLERIPTAEELASPPPEVERMAIQERLRVLHAEQAERLALASWRHGGGPEYHLIDDPDLRLAIGPLLGKIAHSHWWPVSRLGNELGTVRGALTSCPREWTLDPLKIGVLLRTADAAHLDERRAPGFLIALRRPEGISRNHWRFQSQLLKPRVEDDRLVYTTNRPFTLEQVNDWWLCEEALRILDRELHQAGALLADRGHPPRLRARGVAGVESPQRLQNYIEVSGWSPVDARLHVSNVADLARKLGGERLYGDDPTVPLRELIQNAADAIRARRLLESLSDNWGRITVRLGRDDNGPWIEVEDTGIGMSEAVLRGPLLDFGTTYWGSGLMREEHAGLWAKGFEPTGRFGVGFFSVFMWGQRVRISTRRYKEDSQSDTRILEFGTGLEARPIVRPAILEEQLREGGTRVRIWLKLEPLDEGGLLRRSKKIGSDEKVLILSLKSVCAWLAPALDVDLYVNEGGGDQRAVAAFDWITMAEAALLERLYLYSGSLQVDYAIRAGFDLPHPFEDVARIPFSLVYDVGGIIQGRAALFVESMSYLPVNEKLLGVITVGGLRAGLIERRGIIGILNGYVKRVSRDMADISVDSASISRWASGQAAALAGKSGDNYTMSKAAEIIIFHGGMPGGLPVAQQNGLFLSFEMMVDKMRALRRAVFISPIEKQEGLFMNPDVFCVTDVSVMLEFLKVAASRAWGCAVQDISAIEGVDTIGRTKSLYEVGRGAYAWVLRRPVPQN